MKVLDHEAHEQPEISELTEHEVDAVNGGFFGRLLARDKETYLIPNPND